MLADVEFLSRIVHDRVAGGARGVLASHFFFVSEVVDMLMQFLQENLSHFDNVGGIDCLLSHRIDLRDIQICLEFTEHFLGFR